ncbi:MAG: NAD(P)H-dependent glycerol-3-phosphate dehydrogenase [Desulfovibrionaceae bacterium]|nr:NAD(P)H-dependent glycerol-3-phosphate dehydrogenase [Desulfovibrionaceae bacterium]
MDTKPANQVQQVCVAGGGSWGTALAHLAASRGHAVTLYLRDRAVCDDINTIHENRHYLAGLPLHPAVRATTDPRDPDALASPLLVLAVPCQHQRAFLEQYGDLLSPSCILVNASKGIELTTGLTCSQFTAELLPHREQIYAVLSGPSFAREVMMAQPTAVVVASTSTDAAARIQSLFSSPTFRCYTSDDVLGVEVGGAVKNVIAIAAGLCDGLGIGTNGRAALLTRGIAEICRLGVAMGASEHTFLGLSGLGDLVLTATGSLSRNRTLGLALGQGKSLDEASAQIGMVTEGVKTAMAVRTHAARLGVQVPITDAVCAILDGNLSAADAARQLMSRSLIQE